MIEYVTAGESHGKAIIAVITNVPSKLGIDFEFVNSELARRRLGYGRGKRMSIETDTVEFLSGVRGGYTLGSPITMLIPNNDFDNWKGITGANATRLNERTLTAVRPGHADLSGMIKYGFDDARNVLERASARETVARVAVGAIAKQYLAKLGITVVSHTVAIGGVEAELLKDFSSLANLNAIADNDAVRCLDKNASKQMQIKIDEAIARGDALGGAVEIIVCGTKSGIGSYVSKEKRLDAMLMSEIASVPSVKAVEIGDGIANSKKFGSEVHDEIYVGENGYYRKTNRAGGIEGGMSNGENIVIRAYAKPIPTLTNGLNTVDVKTGKAVRAATERSDICVVPALGVICESVAAIAIAKAISDTIGGDTMDEVVERYVKKRSVRG